MFNAVSTAPYTSCGRFGCTTLTPNPKVNGTVNVINNAAISARGGDGIFAFNFGNGNVSVKSRAPVTVTGLSAKNGIEAFSAEIGKISVVASANISGGNGDADQDDQRRDGQNDRPRPWRHNRRSDQRYYGGVSPAAPSTSKMPRRSRTRRVSQVTWLLRPRAVGTPS